MGYELSVLASGLLFYENVRHILLVDDNRTILEGLAIILRTHMRNCNFLTAGNGREALEILASHHVDIIITDLNMPVLDGYELLRLARKHYPDVPCVAMTAGFEPGVTSQRLLALGVSKCLSKPFDISDLRAGIDEALTKVPDIDLAAV